MGSITIPTALAVGSLAVGTIGAGVSAYGSIEAGEANSAAANYQSQVSANNAIIAQQNAQYATAAGEAQVTQSQLKTAAVVGAIKTNQAASGLDVNSGSNVDVQSSAKELGELDALTIRNAAAKQAYGYQVGAYSDVASSQLQSAQSQQALTAGMYGAGTSILGGAASTSNNYLRFLQGNGNSTATDTGDF
jgi:prolyl-tRNA editing enzyme YbaK/EbsC (Cys-tRNA(Pro) deacylase)